MSPVNVYAVPHESTSPRFCAAFAAGAGGRYVPSAERLKPGDVAMFGSPNIWDLLLEAKAAGRDWYYGDHGYFRRGEYYRVTRGAFQATEWKRHDGEGRLARLGVEIQPWRRGGRHVLVCPPSAIHARLMSRADVQISEPDNWGAWAARELTKHTDRPVRIRTKAEAREARRPLEADLADCWAVVVFMSNVGLEAALAGVPVFVLGPAASMVLGRHELRHIENPALPDAPYRRDVAASLAAQQWTLDEITAGDCWRSLS